MTMMKKQAQINTQDPAKKDQREKVWVSCRAKSAMGSAGEGGCGGTEAYVISRQRTSQGGHLIVYQCARCGGSFSTSY